MAAVCAREYAHCQGCTIGCKECGGSNGDAYCGNASDYAKRETLPESHWSYPYLAKAYTKPPCPSTDPGCAVTRKTSCGANPFCAPGSAPVFNPCGVAGGDSAEGAPGNGGNPPPGYKQGADGRTLAKLPGPKRTWRRGEHVNTSWAVIANHGGGCESLYISRIDRCLYSTMRLLVLSHNTSSTRGVLLHAFDLPHHPIMMLAQYRPVPAVQKH